MWKPIKKDNITISAILLAAGIVIAVVTLFLRLSACFAVPAPEMRISKKANIEVISYITLKRSMAQVRLDPAYLPDFSDSYTDQPQVIVHWTIETRTDESYSGTSIGLLTPPYNTFIFSIQDDLEAELSQVHSEQIFINEYRYRILRELTRLQVRLVHPETGNVEAEYTQEYDPDLRSPDPLGPY